MFRNGRGDVVTLTVEQAAAHRNVFHGHTSHKPGKPSVTPTVFTWILLMALKPGRRLTVCYARNEYLLQARHALRDGRLIDSLWRTVPNRLKRRIFNRMNGMRHV
ncbi:MAG: hypothetical protein ACLGJC_07000 [Alphaproteobacteria bacterium]